MKRLLAILFVAIFAASCAAPAPTPSDSTPAPSPAPVVTEQTAAERRADALLADMQKRQVDFAQVGFDGREPGVTTGVTAIAG